MGSSTKSIRMPLLSLCLEPFDRILTRCTKKLPKFVRARHQKVVAAQMFLACPHRSGKVWKRRQGTRLREFFLAFSLPSEVNSPLPLYFRYLCLLHLCFRLFFLLFFHFSV